ncbi:E3 ubiquitin-protein ligase ubr1, partial [Basidiobolus ranarum]
MQSSISELLHHLPLSQYLRQVSHHHNYYLTPTVQSEILIAFLTSLCANNDEYQYLLFPDKDNPDLNESGTDNHELPAYRRPNHCGHLFEDGEVVYHCRTCAVNNACSRCFLSTKHQEHDTHSSINSGLAERCSCGDSDEYGLSYPHHSTKCDSSDEYSSADSLMDTKQVLPDDLLESVRKTVATVLDFILETCLFSPP